MNTYSGDHEHALAGPERARERNDAVARTVPLTVDLVSFTLAGRQDLGVRRDGVDCLVLTEAGALELDAVCPVDDAVQDRIPDRWIAEYGEMPQRLIGESLRSGWLTRIIRSMAAPFRSVTRWCTEVGKLTVLPAICSGYAMRTEIGLAIRIIRLSASTAIAISPC